MKKRLLFFLGQLCLCLYFNGVSVAQEKAQAPAAPQPTGSEGKLSGILTDSLTGKPIAYATVALLQQGSTQALNGTLTGQDGRFTFSQVPAGKYNLAISFIGYKTKTLQVLVTGGNADLQLGTIRLSPAATQLQEVNVQTLRPTITQEADRVVMQVEGSALAAGNTAYDVLAKAPGVYVDQEGNIQLNGRSGITVMLDGKLTYLSARDLRTMLEGMPAENIKNIEVITHPSAKYDAEGSSGILNINLVKNEQRGMNGSVYAGTTYNGHLFGYSTGGRLNYKAGPWNTFVTLDMARRVGGREATFTRVFQGEAQTIYFDQVATGSYHVQGPPAVRLGADYSLNERQSIGFMAYYGTNFLHNDFLTDTYIGTSPSQPELYIDASNYVTNRFTNRTANLHYLAKYDTLGTMLSADLDYARITNAGEANFYNYYDSLASDQPIIKDFLYTHTPNGYDIYSAKVDYSRPLAKDGKLELGAKASRVISDNDSRFYFNNSEAPVLDPNRTNHFVYTENIFAAYLNWSGKVGEHFKVQAGLRAEQTQSRGELRTTGQVTERTYLNLFPSVFVQQKVSDDYELNYSYSRRIERPNYGNLNPFIFYRDPYTWVQGNPYLRPQLSHAFGLRQVFKQDYSLELNYQLNHDVIAEVPVIDAEKATTLYYNGNVDDAQNLSLTAVVPIKILKNWETRNTLVVSYDEYSTIVNAAPIINSQWSYMLQSNHTILLPFELRMELNGAYVAEEVYALYIVKPRWWVHAGIKKSFLDEKLDLSFNVNDVFKSQRIAVASKLGGGNVNDFDQYLFNRYYGVTLRYNFSKGQKVEERQRNSLEELRRTGN
ncbi:outer membrane beta-barrel family protein [Pontibacter chitinilyticus]|uniref:outer membrane beta-barrel family protein n=1 Tax=Pontibacter chitinilyticus TaxID=2674989 RepID=UPI00321A2599